MTRLLIVTVNYHSSTLVGCLLNRLQQIQQQARWPSNLALQFVCVDNSATQDERDALSRIKATTKIEMEIVDKVKNLGYGVAINEGAAGRQFDYLCCINPDVSLENNTLTELLAHSSSHPHQGLWGGVTLDPDSQADFRHAWQAPTLLKTFAWATGIKKLVNIPCLQEDYRHIGAARTQPYPVDNVSGCCLLISSSAWQQLGGFDHDYFLYSEEIDLCRRAIMLGFQPTVVPKATLRHPPHAEPESTKRLRVLFSSKVLYFRKHHGFARTIGYRATLFLGAVLRALQSLLTGRFSTAGGWARLTVTLLKPTPANSANARIR